MVPYSLTEFLLYPTLSEQGTPEHIKKWLQYRAGKLCSDPDEEEYSFYSYVWSDEIASKRWVPTRPTPTRVTGDWMCSVWTTLKKGIKIYDSEVVARHSIKLYKGCEEQLIEYFDEFSIFQDSVLWDFVYSAYTRANLIIVPRGMNRDRGYKYYGVTQDYWDKTMEALLSPPTKDGALSEYRETFEQLLNHFGREGLFLEEWIDEHRRPIMLPSTEPKSVEEWKILAQAMSNRISARREAMTNKHS